MATVTLTKENFNDVTTGGGVVLVDFWAEWCGPCKMFAPVFDEVSESYPEVVFGKVDTEAESEIAGAFEIRSIPTLLIVRDGVIVHSQTGAMGTGALTALVNKVQELDMDQVRVGSSAE